MGLIIVIVILVLVFLYWGGLFTSGASNLSDRKLRDQLSYPKVSTYGDPSFPYNNQLAFGASESYNVLPASTCAASQDGTERM